MRVLTLSLITALCFTGCADEGEPVTAAGTVQLPLVATSSTGNTYRLSPARFRVIGPNYNQLVDGSDVDLLRVGLNPGDYTIRLIGDWVLNLDGEDGFAPVDAVLQSPNPQEFRVAEGEYTDVFFRFGVGEEAIAFGRGQVRVGIDVDDCTPSPEVCNGVDDNCDGVVDNAPECIAEVCDNGVDDDGDGDVDCDDTECADVLGCGVPPVGTTGSVGVEGGADWEVCRADAQTAWISGGSGGGTYNVNTVCQSLGYDGADAFGGNCDTVCGFCGTPGQEEYDGAGSGFPAAYGLTVNWRCANGFIPPVVGSTSDVGVAGGADWEVCRADASSAWISAGSGGGTYDTTAACASLGYGPADASGGNCDTVCGFCGTPGQEEYDGAGTGFPDAYGLTVNWRCGAPAN